MEIAPHVPEWLTWLAAGAVGVFAVTVLARMLDAVLELDAR